MSSKSLLSTKLQIVSTNEELMDAYNFMAKTLNSSTTETPEITTGDDSSSSGTISALGTFFSSSATTGAQVINQNFTFTHSFGTIPSGFIMTDITASGPSSGNSDTATIFRISWTTTQITVRLVAYGTNAGTFNSSFTILVLR